MTLPIQQPLAPMLAKLSDEIPTGEGWLYEPKWDGFRCIVFRDGDEIDLASRKERPFNRYFPELIAPLLANLPERCVVDGEIVVPARDDAGLDFDALLQRIHPAASRVKKLAEETPASFVAFDLLALGDRSFMSEPLSVRRAELDRVLADAAPPVHLCPHTASSETARRWFVDFEGAGLDGIIAKRVTDVYTPDKRTLVKVKHGRTADCVVAGYRVHKDGNGVGSLLLGLYDDDGRLHHVGVASGFSTRFRTELLEEVQPLRDGATVDHPWGEWAEMQLRDDNDQRMPGAGSRWNVGKDLSWVPLRAERVAEVTFGQLQNGRFRHGVGFIRWRDDRTPQSCRYDQLDVASPRPFADIVGAS